MATSRVSGIFGCYDLSIVPRGDHRGLIRTVLIKARSKLVVAWKSTPLALPIKFRERSPDK